MQTGELTERRLEGIGVAPGIAVGSAYLFAKDEFKAERRQVAPSEVDKELERFERAVRKSEKELHKIAAVAREKIGEESAQIMDAQALMLRDAALYDEVRRLIRREREDAGYAVQKIMEEHRRRVEISSNEYLRERANDLLDVQSRLLRHLQRGTIVSKIDSHSIVISDNLTAADIILFSRRHIQGCATSYGGATSHVSLMARALGIPSVVSLHHVKDEVRHGDQVILDGLRGRLIVRPRPDTLETYRQKQQRYQRLLVQQEALIPLPAETMDGHLVRLMANVEVEQEYPLVRRYRADGIGLFRTEVLFLTKGQFPSEDEQVTAYVRAIESVAPSVTTFRMFDLGGDKVMPLGHREQNPFLGWRGIRILLDRPEVMESQIRAILRASARGPSRILIPMVTEVSEIVRFRDVLQAVQDDLRADGVAFQDPIPLGAMIEVPSLALMADELAAEVDFFSVGSNDLTQYLLAVDRGNDLVSDLYHELHPAVLKVLRHVFRSASRAGIPVGLCGEMAAQPRAVPILLGLGLREFSASPSYLPDIKRVVRGITLPEAEELAEQALRLHGPKEVEALVDEWLREHACDIRQLVELGLPDGEPGKAGNSATSDRARLPA